MGHRAGLQHARKGNVMTRVLAVDPGETTGYCLIEANDGSVMLATHGSWSGLEPYLEPTALASNLIKSASIVIVEDFRIYPHAAQAMIGRELFAPKELGRIELVCEIWSKPLHYQMASEAKQIWNNRRFVEKLPAFYQAITNIHARDAARHALCYIEKQGLVNFFRKEDAI